MEAAILGPVIGAGVSIVSAIIIVAASYGGLNQKVNDHIESGELHMTHKEGTDVYIPRREWESFKSDITKRLDRIEHNQDKER